MKTNEILQIQSSTREKKIVDVGMWHTYSTKRPQSKGPASQGPASKGPAKKGWALKDLGYTRSRERKILDLEHRRFRQKTAAKDYQIQYVWNILHFNTEIINLIKFIFQRSSWYRCKMSEELLKMQKKYTYSSAFKNFIIIAKILLSFVVFPEK